MIKIIQLPKLLCSLICLSVLLLFNLSTTRGEELLFAFDNSESTLKFTTEGAFSDWTWRISPYLSANDYQELELNLSEAYLDWEKGSWDFSIGRKIITFGPGRYGYPMLGPVGEGASAQGYDQVGYSFEWNQLKYQKFYALVPEERYRMLLGQRTTFDWGNFTFGFSETALVNNEAPNFYYLPIPFIPVYFYQFLASRIYEIEDNNDSGNFNVDFDIEWRVKPNLKIYFEYFIDDRPWPRLNPDKDAFMLPEWDQHPWRLGYQLGSAWQNAFKRKDLTLYAEYTRINQFTYTGLNRELDYTYDDRILGDPLGPDADRFNLELAWEYSPEWQWRFTYINERHGSGKIGDEWQPVPGQTEVFLTGVVESSNSLFATLVRKINNYELGFTLGLEAIHQKDNLVGNDDLVLKVGLSGKMVF